MRRMRDRRHRKLLPVCILLSESEIAALVQRELLAPEVMTDKNAVRKAFHDRLNTGVLC